MLEVIDLKRAQTGNQNIGWAIEKRILDRELQDLEAAVVAGEAPTPAAVPQFGD